MITNTIEIKFVLEFGGTATDALNFTRTLFDMISDYYDENSNGGRPEVIETSIKQLPKDYNVSEVN